MQMTNALISNTATASAAAAGAASQGTATVAGAANQTRTFGQLLVQAIGMGEGAAAANGQVSNLLPDLAQLLGGLLSGLTGDEAAALLADTADGDVGDLLAEQLTDNPELLAKLLDDEGLQGWLLQAALLLQGMQRLPEEAIPEGIVLQGGGAEQGSQPQAPAIGLEQAQLIMKSFIQAHQEQPDHIFIGQLQEKLAAVLSKEGESVPAASQDKSAGHGTNAAAPDKSGLQWSVSSSPAVRLEALAAKYMPLKYQELTGSSGNASRSEDSSVPSRTAADELQTPVAVVQDGGRLPLAKADGLEETATVRAHALAEDISKFITGKLRVQTGNGLTEARLTMSPEALGQVEVRLSLQNGQLAAHFAAQTAMGKDALEAQLAQLRAALQSQGIQVEKIEVTQSAALQSSLFHDQRGQQQAQQWSRQNEGNAGSDGSEEYAAEATEILRSRSLAASDSDGFDVTA